MSLFNNDKRKIKILKILEKEEKPISMNSLTKKLKITNVDSVKRCCLFLKEIRLIDIVEERIGEMKQLSISIKKDKKS